MTPREVSMRVTILRTLEEVRSFVPTWGSLPLTNPFSGWDYARGWLERSLAQPFLVIVRDSADVPVAMAPWCLRRNRGGIRQVTGIWGYDAWFHDPWIRDPELAPAVSELLVATLRAHRREWDSLDLILRAEFSAELIARLDRVGWGFVDRPGDRQNRIVEFGESWERYWKSRPSEYRRTLKQAQKKLDLIPHRYVEADAESYPPLLEAALELTQSRYDPSGERSLWYQAIRELAAGSAARGELFAYGLEVEGRWAAVNVAFRAGERAYGTIQAYDPAFSTYSAGHLMTAWAYERMVASGIRRLDLGDGAMPWKDRVKTGVCETVLVQVGRTLSGKALVGWRKWVKPRLEEAIARHAVRPSLEGAR